LFRRIVEVFLCFRRWFYLGFESFLYALNAVFVGFFLGKLKKGSVGFVQVAGVEI